MSPPSIPGFYWDAEKGRYFKIESRATAPLDAPWSSDKVKKRQSDDKAATAKATRAAMNMNRITPSRVLNEPQMGGFLAREQGKHGRDHATANFAQGLDLTGVVPFCPTYPSRTNPTGMCVTDKKNSLGVYNLFTTLGNDTPIWNTAITREYDTGRVGFLPAPGVMDQFSYTESHPEETIPQVSDIKYDKQRNLVLVTSRRPSSATQGVLSTFTPRDVNTVVHRAPPSGLQNHKDRLSMGYEANTVCVTPSSFHHVCLVGTSVGLAAPTPRGDLKLITPNRYTGFETFVDDAFRDIFSMDFHVENPRVMFFGGRYGDLVTADFRHPNKEWQALPMVTSIAHVKSVGEHHTLVAGIENTLSVFDMRYCTGRTIGNDVAFRRAPTPVVRMAEYKNSARFDVGLDYDRGSGVVAAAHNDGTVALYSVRSGNRLQSRDIDNIHSEYGQIHHLQFQTFEGDATPHLFVGMADMVHVYSFDKDDTESLD
ncbi:hypothetical protein F4804DRAFT_305319 [Jackrogersella minutella]|nr:hypothetical protein F4804DRAFT_305319 [Jackrogersella minutella]